MQADHAIEVRGRIRAPVFRLTRADCERFPAAAQVDDVGALAPGKRGRGVKLAAILARAGPAADARFLDIASADPAFAISVPLDEVAERGVVVYALDGAPIPSEKGGPFRLIVPGHADECVNVKALAALELSARRGRDTRPLDDAEHAKLHAKKKH
jgi:DMSO/TMAO reductase YedYZ molybdopterin-dependent catalytic subunit